MDISEGARHETGTKAASPKKKITRKQEIIKLHRYSRALIQLLYFIFIPSVYTAAFSGVKYVFTQIGNEEAVEFTAFVSVLAAVCVFTFVFGRFFCGFACAFGSFSDALHALYKRICKRMKKKPVKLPEKLTAVLTWVKYIVLAAILILCFEGIYGSLSGYSPWTVFSMIHALNFNFGQYIAGCAILLILAVGMFIQERFFCRFFCPMGAVFSILPVLPFFTIRRDRENCIKGCSACAKNCPADVELAASKSFETSGECFQCQKCTDTCPGENIHTGIEKLKGNEFFFTLLRALLLLLVLKVAGI